MGDRQDKPEARADSEVVSYRDLLKELHQMFDGGSDPDEDDAELEGPTQPKRGEITRSCAWD